ncbi:MAG TPA: 3-hydroxyacyl-CoA dehydrogenase family protein [Pyrinomonadaceae bacterium]|jgi:3-hydroxybutyryl-CoA dehydrogenase|nr:3-hydroxyacyl-CoA dehydrogenase family protein [Pyrinomonadaceae bacterium]
MEINTTGVVGAGVMGVGVAQSMAQAGLNVLLIDLNDAILDDAERRLRQNLRLHAMLNRGGAGATADEVMGRIVFSTDYRILERADFVVENTTERWEVKQGVYRELDAVCPARCVLAANTSAIPITRLASATGRAPQVIGMHFMNPVPMKKTVEVILGHHTSDETLAAAKSLLSLMGKDCMVVKDSPGFVSNRVLMLTINEAAALVHEQVAAAEDVDKIFRDCFGHKMGPLETADLIGLDTILLSIEALYEAFNDSKYRPSPLLKRMVYAGLHGRKSGQGFYTYKTAAGDGPRAGEQR